MTSIYDDDKAVEREIERIAKWIKKNKCVNVSCYDDKKQTPKEVQAGDKS